MYFWKKLGTKYVTKCNHRDHPCTFGNLEIKSKILGNHRDHPFTLLKASTKKQYGSNGLKVIQSLLKCIKPPTSLYQNIIF
ncbi:hypothetical protein Hanom_Chr15g01411401 [Helianthus anomalus]